jgi:iron(III) transport system permease protein
VTGKSYRKRLVPLGRIKFWAWVFLGAYFLANMFVPFVLLVWSSLLPVFQTPSAAALAAVSLRNFYEQPWDLVVSALTNTSFLAVATPTLSIALSVIFSWVVLRSRLPGRQYFDVIAFLPHAVPSVIFGVGTLVLTLFFVQHFVPIYGTVWVILAVFVIVRLSYGTRMTNNGLVQIHKELEEAAVMCRASPWIVVRKILIPLLAPTIFYAWIWIALLTFRELTLAVFVTTTSNLTLSVVIWSIWEGGNLGKASALTLIMLAIIVPIIAVYWLFARKYEPAAN